MIGGPRAAHSHRLGYKGEHWGTWHLQFLPLAPSLLLLKSIFFSGDSDDELRRFPLGELILVHQAVAP